MSIHILQSTWLWQHAKFLPSGIEALVTCFWIGTVALLSWECQTRDAAEDVVSDVFTADEVVGMDSTPNQDAGMRSLRAATALASINCVLFAVTLLVCKCSSPDLQSDFRLQWQFQ